MAISCICHYRPAHKLVTAHLECRAPSQRDPTLDVRLSIFAVSFFYTSPLVLLLLLPLSLLPLKLPFLFSILIYPRRARAFCRCSLCRGRRSFRWDSFGGSVGPIASHKLDVLREMPATGSFAWRWDRASIVIVPHQRRFAINLSSCRGTTDERYHDRTTLGIPRPNLLDKL